MQQDNTVNGTDMGNLFFPFRIINISPTDIGKNRLQVEKDIQTELYRVFRKYEKRTV